MTRSFLLIYAILLFPAAILTASDYPVIFTRQISGNDHIFLMFTDGTLKQVTNHSRKDSSPIISSDGKMMVFASERVGWWKIWRMDVHNREFRQLTFSSAAAYAPFWSPDGSRIVFVSGEDGDPDLYLMNKDGENQRNLTRNSTTDSMPFWGNDGLIYYTAEVKGIYQIARIDPVTGISNPLTTDEGNKYMPQLSPDGKLLLFYGDRHGNAEVYRMSLSDREIVRLTDNALMDMRARWSPDGKQIVFENGNKKDNQQIFTMNADGGDIRQLTFDFYNYSPAFVADCSLLCLKN